jgi:hypothetical protein
MHQKTINDRLKVYLPFGEEFIKTQMLKNKITER